MERSMMSKPLRTSLNENAQAWVEALRSGKYKQGKGVLANDNGEFCCLGVACELALEAGIIDQKILETPDYSNVGPRYRYGTREEASVFTLPSPVSFWLGLATHDGRFQMGSKRSTLADENDRGQTFDQIAALIESEPEGLFV